MEIKRTRILHKRLTQEQWLDSKNYNLRQGEIGVLINELGETQEVRIGLKDTLLENGTITGTSFFNCMVIGTNEIESQNQQVKSYRTRFDFPGIGSENCIYIDKSTDSIYRWDDNDNYYYKLSSLNDWHEIKEIHGGNAKI